MADTVITRQGGIGGNFKGVATTAVVVKTDGNMRAGVTTSPVISAGAGAPAGAAPNGSLYLRTDGAGDSTIYVMVSASWIAADLVP